MQGFKSFAEPVTLELNEGITCIVGPNGSGKSNISDAISWVLGEQSPKMLRGGKMDEVIFAGTASRKSRGMAEVTLVIDNSEEILPIDYAEVAITRRMYRSGESEYAINNNPCRLRDIRELIVDTGMGVDGYSIIRQGKISDIISNKTESRREIFESAAGIVTYRNKKAEAERKLASANQQLERVNDIVSEIERRIGSLKEESEKATEYLVLRERFRELEINITLKNLERIQTNSEALETELAHSKEEVDSIKKEKEVLDRQVEETRVRNEELEKKTQEASERQLILIDELNQLLNAEKIYGERRINLETNIHRLEKELMELEERFFREKENAQGQYRIKGETDTKLKGLREELQGKMVTLEKLERQYQQSVALSEEKKSEVFTLLTLENNKRAEAQSVENLKENLVRRKEKIWTESTREEEENKEVLLSREEILLQVKELEKEIESLKNQWKTGKEAQAQLGQREQQRIRDLEQLKIEMGQLLSRKRTIEEMEANYEGYNHAVKYIMKSGLKGLHGTVAELIKVPPGFEVAIETALGGNIQNIICQEDKDAEKAISLLKESRSGRLTFLPVTSLRSEPLQRNGQVEGAKGFQGFAAEVVTCEAPYQRIKEYLLGKVVIFDTMENAIVLSKNTKGFRYVTLEGEFINANGAITGGRHRNNTANLLERKAEVEKLGHQLDQRENEKVGLEKELSDLHRELEEVLSMTTEKDVEIRAKEMELLTQNGACRSISEHLTGMNQRKDQRQQELQLLEEEAAQGERMMQQLLKEAEEAGQRAKEWEREVEALISLQMDQKQQLEGLNEEITRCRMTTSSWESEKQGVDAIVSMIEKSIEEIAREKEKKEHLKLQYQQEKEKILTGTGSDVELLKDKEKEKTQVEEQLKQLRLEKGEVFQKLTRVSKEKEALDARLEEISTQRMEMEIKRGKNETLVDTYKEKLWEEFEISYAQALEWKREDFVLSSSLRENREIKNRMRELGEINVGAIAEYQEVKERYDFLTEQREDIMKATDSLNRIILDTDKIIKARFKESFNEVAGNFEDFFRELFGGGSAQLVLEDPEKPLESEIDIIAQPPGKKLSNISLLSGGEKTMTAIALMFAVLKTKPTPFCILDEVEAALDETNINRFIKTLHHFEDDIQFTLVTHQKATMEHADTLYGVTMAEQGISKVISLKLGDEFDLGEN
jgi:chromosome segregation protein